MNKIENEETLVKAFATFDADNSGFITNVELMTSLEVRSTCSPNLLLHQISPYTIAIPESKSF